MVNWSAYQETLVGLPVAKRAKHGLHFKRPDGLIQADFSGAPCHYLDTDNLWKPIDTRLIAVGAEFGAAGIPIRFRLDGRIAVGTHVQQTQRIGLFNPTTKAFSLLATLPTGLILDDKLIRESGIFREEITLKEGGVREELIVSSMPSGGSGDWLVLETRIDGGNFPDGDTAEFSREGYKFPLPNALDANGKRLLARRFARKIGAVQYLLTGVLLATLASAVFPVMIDPDFGTSSDTWIDLDGPTDNYSTSTELRIGEDNRNTDVDRGLVKSDISSIPPTATVVSATQKMFIGFSDLADNNGTLEAYRIKRAWVSAQATWNIFSTGNNWGTAGCANTTTDRDVSNSGTVTVVNGSAVGTEFDIVLTVASMQEWVNGTMTNDGLLLKMSAESNDSFRFASSKNATPSYRPVLTVVYSVPAVSVATRDLPILSSRHNSRVLRRLPGFPSQQNTI